MSTPRTISIVNRYELKISGCCHKDAIAFGDVDNDGVNELIVGQYNGVVFIYKAGSPRPWRRATGCGVVAAVAVGDIFNVGHNSLVVVSAEVCVQFLTTSRRRTRVGGYVILRL